MHSGLAFKRSSTLAFERLSPGPEPTSKPFLTPNYVPLSNNLVKKQIGKIDETTEPQEPAGKQKITHKHQEHYNGCSLY